MTGAQKKRRRLRGEVIRLALGLGRYEGSSADVDYQVMQGVLTRAAVDLDKHITEQGLVLEEE